MITPIELWAAVVLMMAGVVLGWLARGFTAIAASKRDARFVDSFLVDLDRYEADLLLARNRGKMPIPLRPIPSGVPPRFSRYDWEVVLRNREKADAIKRRIFKN